MSHIGTLSLKIFYLMKQKQELNLLTLVFRPVFPMKRKLKFSVELLPTWLLKSSVKLNMPDLLLISGP
jgi:hypothetical protein